MVYFNTKEGKIERILPKEKRLFTLNKRKYINGN